MISLVIIIRYLCICTLPVEINYPVEIKVGLFLSQFRWVAELVEEKTHLWGFRAIHHPSFLANENPTHKQTNPLWWHWVLILKSGQ